MGPMTTANASNNGEKIITKAESALVRYRVMAIVTGTMLLLLCIEMLLRYAFHADSVVKYIKWIPFAHGWIYVVYLVTVLDLWTKMRWRFGRLAAMVLAGVIPVLSFIVEHRVTRDARIRVAAARDLAASQESDTDTSL